MAADAVVGLSSQEAAARLDTHGPNFLESTTTRPLGAVLLSALHEPTFLFLLAAAFLYLFIGDLGEGLFMLASASVSIGLVVFQDARSERALAALRQLAEPYAHVIRDGFQQRIPARTIVPGDLLLIIEGERIPADGFLRSGGPLTVDESTLTGESVTIVKIAGAVIGNSHRAGTEVDTGDIFAGTMPVRGQALAEVTFTGARTRLGAIGMALKGETEQTPLQVATGRLVARLSGIAAIICLMVAAAYGVLRGDWLAGGLAGLTVAISLMPEEFPMVLAVFLAIGSWRLGRHRVLVRRAAVIETLGAVTMLCVDKTGTLTENRMKLTGVWTPDSPHSGTLDNWRGEVAATALLASSVHPVDPMDRAIHDALPEQLADILSESGGAPEKAYPLRPDLLAVIQGWRTRSGMIWAAKGAPEAILKLCALDAALEQKVQDALAAMAAHGMRVLGVAKAGDAGPKDPRHIQFEFLGLLGFVDPLREDVTAALAEARQAGIDVAMVSGDYPATALEVAREAGFDVSHGAMTGAEISTLAPEALLEKVGAVRVFARVKPEQKLALVEAFKARGDVVAMTGDGINDAPALERAHVGIAMGKRGTDVAREAADLVLLDDNFASIVGGVRLGRRIFANLRKALTYVMAIHIPIAGVALLPILLGLPQLLYPMHVVVLELIIDPVCSLVFESERSDSKAMRRPPRSIHEPLFGRRQMKLAAIQGLVLLAAVIGLYAWGLHSGIVESQARAMGFITLVSGNLFLALAEASEVDTPLFDRRHMVFWIVSVAAALILAGVLTIPFLSSIFRISAPSGMDIVLALFIALLCGGWYAAYKRLTLEKR